MKKVLLVLLRLVIGWHFLYEGVYKIEPDVAGQLVLTSRHHLQAETGRLRDYFEQQPHGARSAEEVHTRLATWHDEIAGHFKSRARPLSEEQLARLASVRDELLRSTLNGKHSDGLPVDWYTVHEHVLEIASEQEGAGRFSALDYLQGSTGPFRGVFHSLVPDPDGLGRLTVKSAHERLEERYSEILNHYRQNGWELSSEQRSALAQTREELKQSIAATLADPRFRARVEDYTRMLARIREQQSNTETAFLRERLDEDRRRLATMGTELVSFVDEPVTELAVAIQEIVSVDQMRAGPPPPVRSQTALLDGLVKWGLLLVGLCLVLGLFTPVAAVGAAAFLAMFYLAMPPWPGLPEVAADGHYLIVDRNLIELFAVLVVAAFPTGRWAGLDFWVARLWSKQA